MNERGNQGNELAIINVENELENLDGLLPPGKGEDVLEVAGLKCKAIMVQARALVGEADKLIFLQGAILTEIKERFGRPRFQEFCEGLGIAERTGYNYISLFKHQRYAFMHGLRDTHKIHALARMVDDDTIKVTKDAIIFTGAEDGEKVSISVDEANALPRVEFIDLLKKLQKAARTQKQIADIREESLENKQKEIEVLRKKLEAERAKRNDPIFDTIGDLYAFGERFGNTMKLLLENKELTAEHKTGIRRAALHANEQIDNMVKTINWEPDYEESISL